MPLPININKLLKGRVIEWDRVEFKKGWNPEEVIRTICAFANDINNWGGGYIIIGVDEMDGKPVFPPAGLQENQIDRIQKELVELCHKIERMQLLKGPTEYLRPVNVALLFFNPEPHKFFRGAISEVVLYKDYDGITFTEKTFKGSLFKQIRNLLEYLRSVVLTEKIIKIQGQAEALRIWNYPYQAVEEVVANAFYHRSYENVSPIEISVYPDKMVVLSFPCPLPPVDKEMLKKKKIISREYRNRRIGDFLKELDLTEGRGTGFPIVYGQMALNGSPEPIFETDDIHTHFTAILPVHPEFLKEEAEDNDKKTNLPTLDSPKALEILEFCREAKSRKEIMDMLEISNNTRNFEEYIKPLIIEGTILLTIPQKPNSPKQQYYTSELSWTKLD